MNRSAKLIPILLAMFVALAIGGVVYAEPPTERPGMDGVTLIVGGVEKPVRLGQVVYAPPGGASDAPGDSDGPLACNTPLMTITIEGSAGISGVTVSTDEDCVVSVTEITPVTIGPAAYSDPQERRYRGWVKSELDDDVGIDVTAVYTKFDYYDNAEMVYGDRYRDGYCYYFWYPGGWSTSSCSASWWPHGSAQVYTQ